MTKTREIFELTAPYDNPYQGAAHRALFVCSAGLLRSATMANYYAKHGWNTRAAGSSEYALVPVSANLLAWANQIYFVNRENYMAVRDKFAKTEYATKIDKAVILNIPDIYEYNDPHLIKDIEEQMND
jgi:protein-tyrosine phosphatase